jgi:hypothetical protein
MATLYIKIYEYNEDADSITVGFASSETSSQNPDDYQPLVYDLKYLYQGCKTVEELRDNLAHSCLGVCEDIKMQEALDADVPQKNIYKSMVGQIYSVDSVELIEGEQQVTYGAEVTS